MVIYKTTNLLDGKFYIGKDEKNNPNYLGSGLHLKKAIKKYGINNFIKEIIEICNNREELNEREIFWIKELFATTHGYNIADGGTGGKTTPVIHNKGKTNEELYGIEKANQIKDKKRLAITGKKHSDETKEKISKGNIGKKHSDETKEKMSKAHIGKTVSDETKEKISLITKEYFKDINNRINLSEKHKGKVLSEEHKNNISKGHKNKKD